MTTSLRAERNRTIVLSPQEKQHYLSRLRQLTTATPASALKNSTIHQDVFTVLPLIEEPSIDLLFIDPPYNITKSFNGRVFKRRNLDDYASWFDALLKSCMRLLKPTASIYVCGDWHSSAAIHYVLERYCNVRNRITWEREKGCGATSNWKNCSEDIWFCTVSDDYGALLKRN